MNTDECIKLQMKDQKEITIKKVDAELSELLKGTMNDYPKDSSIPLPEVNSKEGERIVEFLEHCKGKAPKEIEKPLPTANLKELLTGEDEWYFEYISKFSIEEIADLVVAANFMEIQPLIDLCCAKIASLCKDKTEEEILKNFNITESFTEEEKAKIREENKWIEDNL